MKKITNSRALACQVLLKVTQGKPLQSSWVTQMTTHLNEREQAFILHLCFGVLRYYYRLQEQLQKNLHRPLKAKDSDLKLLMLIGLYQLLYSDTPAYAAINETVKATNELNKSWARALVNRILRQVSGQTFVTDSLTAQWNHPQWFIDFIKEAWPQHWQMILQANLEHPPFMLRVNLSKISRADYLLKLQQANITSTPLAFSPAGLQIHGAVKVEQLPGFTQGFISVQDEAAQLACSLLALEPHLRILDACAAPGGKTSHLLEAQPHLHIDALEKAPSRLVLLKQTLSRLGFKANLIEADATQPDTWWDQQPFDRILLDAPCSASGVIRRHPDIKLHRQEGELKQLAEYQHLLLKQLWPLLKPNGLLLYATCSIFPQENVQLIQEFIANQVDAKEEPIYSEWGIAQKYGRQILPGQHQMDGFYYARLRKTPLS